MKTKTKAGRIKEIKEIEELRKRLEVAEEKLISDEKNETGPLPTQRLARSILDQATELIIICDKNGRIIQTSQMVDSFFTGRLLGHPFDNVCPLTLTSALPYESKQFSISPVLAGKIFQSLEVTHRREGQISYFLLSARPLTNNGKGLLGCIVTLIDVTQRKQMEEALREANERLVLAQQSAGAGIWDWDMAAGQLNWSPELFRLFGLDPETAGASFDSWRSVLHPEDREVAEARIELTIRNHTPLASEYRIILPAGEVRWINALGNTMYDDRGKPQRMSGICIDITERKQMEETIAHLASFPQLNPNPITEVDLTGHIYYLNPAAERLFRDLQKEGLNHPWLRDLEKITSMLKSEPERAHVRELRVGDTWYQQTTQSVMEGYRFRIYGFDITKRKHMEEELKKSRDELEIKVQERTVELRNLNAALQIEIDERKRAEKALKEQSKILEGFFTSTITPLVLLDRGFNFIRVNEAYAKACQRDVSEFPGQNHFKLYPHEENKTIFRRVVETKIPFQAFAKPFTFPDHPEWGTTYWNWTLTPILNVKGEVEFLVFSLEDVTNRVQTEKERTRLAHIVETTSDLIGMANLDGQLFYLNKAGRKMLGLSKEEDISGVRIADTHPDWANVMVLNEGIPNALQTGFWSGETVFLSRDGTEIPASQVILAHKGVNGEVEFLSTIARDITERRRAAEAVEVERQRFNDVLEILPAYLVLLTPDYHVPFANRFFRERFGESHGLRCFEYLFGRTEPCETCETYTVLKTIAPHQWEWTGPDGRNYHVFDFPFTDADGSTLILEMGIDITERKRAEEALHAASLYTRSLIEVSLDPLVTISANGKVMDVNKATELVTGVSREQLIGSDFSNYFTEPEKAREGYKKVFSEGSVRDYPLAIQHKSGIITDVLYNASVYRNETGEVQGIFAAARDITERKEAEKRNLATNALLRLFAEKSERKEYLDAVVELIQRWSGCRCAGIRVLDERGYIPYEAYVGFSQEFWEKENWISVHKDSCACIRVVMGNPDPQDFSVMTPQGSFYCGNTSKLLAQLSEEEKARFRGVCVQNGFLSVYVIPICYHEKIFGVIHLADEREERLTLKGVEFIESMAPLIGEAINRFTLEEELRESENRLRTLSSQLLSVQENERKRISREIHDSLGQSLSAIKFKVEEITQQMREGRQKKMAASLETILPIIRASIEESRRIQMDLRPSVLDDLGIIATLTWFSREFQQTYPNIRIEKEMVIEENELPDPLKTVIYRISQEALNNIAKHSKANLVRLSIGKEGDSIELTIQDNGMGFNLEEILAQEWPKRGGGLTSMRERTELSGGTFAIESTIGKGTTIKAAWPI